MSHGHDHVHHGPAANRTALAWTLALTLGYMVAEIVGGYLSDSLALLADAGHMFSDAAGLGLSLFAAWISLRPATAKHSYGYHRAEILAALANGASLIAVTMLIFVEAARRFQDPEPVAGPLMAAVATGGLAINLICLAILGKSHNENLNVKGAWLHLVGDALGSVSALVAAGLVWKFGWLWADPVASIIIGLLVVYASWNLVRQAIDILMESTPSHIDVKELEAAMAGAAGVREVHDLHVWTITSGRDSLSAHVVIDGQTDPRAALDDVRHILHDRFGIDHMTIQVESPETRTCSPRH